MPHEADIVFSWFSSVPDSVKALFTRPTEFKQIPTPPPLPEGDKRNKYAVQLQQLGWPHPLKGILGNYAKGIKPLRVAFMGFSEGCQGLSGMLRSQDAGFIDTVIAVDGIHALFIGDVPNKDRSNVFKSSLAPWIEYSKIASNNSINPGSGLPVGRRNCIISHSAIVPPKYVSTTATSKIILDSLFGDSWPVEQLPSPLNIISASYSPPIVIHGNKYNNNKITEYKDSPIKYAVHKNGLYVFGFSNIDSSGVNDHIYQANVVSSQILTELLAPNWNSVDPTTAVCVPVSRPIISASYSSENEDDVSSCSLDSPTVVPGPIADPDSTAPLPDGSINYDKWIPEDEKKTGIQKTQEMLWYMKTFFTLLAIGLGYAGVKATDAIVNAANEYNE